MSEAGIDPNNPYGTDIPGWDLEVDLKYDDLTKYKDLFGTEPDSDSFGNLIRLAGGVSDLFGGGGGGTSLKDLEKKMEKLVKYFLRKKSATKVRSMIALKLFTLDLLV